MSTVLTIDGVAIDLDNSAAVLNRLTLSVEQPDCLEFGVWNTPLPVPYHDGQAVELTVDGTLVFKGQVAGTFITPIGDGPVDVGYRALGLRYLANTLTVTNPQTGTGTIQFNLPQTDPNFIQSMSGQSVGQILKFLFDAHATALASVGVTGYNASDLTPLTIVPPAASGVLIQGNNLFDQIDYFIKNWYAQYVMFVPADGIIRVLDSTAFAPTTFTLDSDPITLAEVQRGTENCYTRVVVRGWAEVEPAYLSLKHGTLKEAFTAEDKLQWTWYAYTQPTGYVDSGTITLLTSTQVTVQSNSPTETFPVNYWPGIEAFIQLINPANTDITFTENRQITANTAMAAGGTAVITIDLPLVNSGYTEYYIWGQPPKVSETWRLYDIVPTWVATHLVKQFPFPVPWMPAGSALVMTNFPVANVCWSPDGQSPYIEVPFTFELLPETGQIRFTEPVVRVFGTLSNLEKGGTYTDGIPDDIKVLVPYSRGPLSAVCPADAYGAEAQYSGTAYTVDGIERTLYRDYPQWMWGNDASSYQQLACQILATVSNTVVSSTVTYWGKYSAALTLGMAVNVARVGGTTGLEAINAAVRTVVLEWPQTGPSPWITHLSFSTVRMPFSGDQLYIHPMFAQGRTFGGDGFEGINPLSTESYTSGLSNTLGAVFGSSAGNEMAAGMLGNSGAVRDALGLGPLEGGHERSERQREESAEGGAPMPEWGMDWDAQPRRRRRRKRPTLIPKPKVTGPTEAAAGEADPFRMGSAPAEAARNTESVPIGSEARRRQRAERSGPGVRGRYDADEARPKPTPPAASPEPPSAETQREQRARERRRESRYDDGE